MLQSMGCKEPDTTEQLNNNKRKEMELRCPWCPGGRRDARFEPRRLGWVELGAVRS